MRRNFLSLKIVSKNECGRCIFSEEMFAFSDLVIYLCSRSEKRVLVEWVSG